MRGQTEGDVFAVQLDFVHLIIPHPTFGARRLHESLLDIFHGGMWLYVKPVWLGIINILGGGGGGKKKKKIKKYFFEKKKKK